MRANAMLSRGCALTLSLVLSVLALASASSARAQVVESDEPDLADVEARALFSAGVAAYDAGRYEDALDSFERAYQRSQRPELLYNVGQCYDRLRRDEEAIASFERYLEARPAAENRPQVEARLRALREAIARRSAPTEPPIAPAQVAAAATPAPAPMPGPALTETSSHRPRRIALIATSVVVVVAVVVLSVVLAGGGNGGYAGSDVGTVFALHGAGR